MKVLFPGGAGFIGSHAVEELLQRGHEVIVVDNLSTGKERNLEKSRDFSRFKFVLGDVLDFELLDSLLRDVEVVFHFSDNSDIQYATEKPQVYINQNIVGLFRLLELMRKHRVNKILFPSSTTVIGDAKVLPTPEFYGPLFPMNLYGAGKMACEALLSAYAHSFGIQAWVFRFVGIVGARMDHGVILDFIKKLKNNPESLQILGNGRQQRNFLIVEDCVDAILKSFEKFENPMNLIHIGNSDDISILRVAEIVRDVVGFSTAQLRTQLQDRGWTGDALSNAIACNSLESIGWKPSLFGSEQTVREAAKRLWLQSQQGYYG